jgi:hypothetical protein
MDVVPAPDLPNAASQITSNAALASEAIQKATNQLWQDVLNGGLYEAITQLGLFFAVGTLMIFLVQWAKALIDGEDSRAISELIWPIIVVTLLANNGMILKEGTYGLRNVINVVNQNLLNSTTASLVLQDAVAGVLAQDQASSELQALLTNCQSLPDLQQQTTCVENAINTAQQTQNSQNFPNQIFETFQQLSNFLNTNPLEHAIRGILMAMAIGFQWVVEISLLLTALLGPLAVGGSLLPVGQKAIFAWLTGFYSVGMVKLSFNIVVGLVATLVTNAETATGEPGTFKPISSLVFPFVVGLLAPILSLVLAGGAGMAVFNSFSSIAQFGLSSVLPTRRS